MWAAYSGEHSRLACWRTRPRGRGLSVATSLGGKRCTKKDCFGATPKPARETRALPRTHACLKISRSQHACFLETEIAGVPFRWRADDDVIKQFDLQQFGGFSQTSREAVIGLARRRIAGRMIVHNDHSISRVGNRRAKNFARMSDALVQAADRNLLNMQKAISRIEQDDAQRFSS